MIIKLAWRSLWRNKRRTVISIVSISFGLTIAVFFISLGEGMYETMIDQAVRMQSGHITLEHERYGAAPAVDLWVSGMEKLRSRIQDLEEVEQTKAVILGQGIAKSGRGNVAAAIMGVEPDREVKTSPLPENIVQGAYLEEGDGARVVIGAELAERLQIEVGKKLVLTTNNTQGDLVEELCRVKGVFRTGSNELDGYFVQIPLPFAQKLFGLPKDGVTRLAVVLSDSDDQDFVLEEIQSRVRRENLVILPWQRVLPELASYIKLDRGSNFIFQGILLFLILFTIFNTLLMSVLERQREFAMLLALGTEPRLLKGQVFMESVFLAFLGCVVGVILGWACAMGVDRIGVDLSAFLDEGISISGFAMSTRLQFKVSLSTLATIGGVVFVATVLLGLIPMRKAVRVNVADTLR